MPRSNRQAMPRHRPQSRWLFAALAVVAAFLLRPGAALLHAADGCSAASSTSAPAKKAPGPEHAPAACPTCAALAQQRDWIVPPGERDSAPPEMVVWADPDADDFVAVTIARGLPKPRGPPAVL